MVSRDVTTIAGILILPAEKERNFFDLAQILGSLPKAGPGVRHVRRTEVVKKLLKRVRFMRHMVPLFC